MKPARLAAAVMAVLASGCGAGHTAASHATVTPAAATTGGRPPGVPLDAVGWSSVDYPLDCGGQGTRVLQVAYVTPQPGTKVALVLLDCDVGAGTPPSALLAYDEAASVAAPHLAQTLLGLHDFWLGSRLSVNGARVSLPAAGYSSSTVARAKPDVSTTLTWAWQGGQFLETDIPPSHQLLPR